MRRLSNILVGVAYLIPLLFVLLVTAEPIIFAHGDLGTQLLVCVVAASGLASGFAIILGRESFLALPKPRPARRTVELVVAALPLVGSLVLLLATGFGVAA
jgi:hypothetical protein